MLGAIAQELPAGAQLTILERPLELPIFNTDHAEPAEATTLKQAIADADGVVFSVPEYNYSIPGGLKNALDWISCPPATSPLRAKAVAMVGAASGMSGTIRAQVHMRSMLVYSDSAVLGQPEVTIPRAQDRFDAAGQLHDESTRLLLAKFGVAFVAFVQRHLATHGT